ncbi:MAG: 23S rRNA (pseudouridine(1915)-N(3))-methyltransferase RlmH [Eubacterium sp.]|nr:23S rRNA (pseudouridine(1915)-N(3))-methyltransferase RlmH [Eubacterium sp.]
MKITIVCAGKLKKGYFKEGIEDYKKRLSRFCTAEIREVDDEKTPQNASEAEENEIRRKEGMRLLAAIPKDSYVVTLEIKGRMLSSEQMADRIRTLTLSGVSSISFVIGGSLGLAPEVIQRADAHLSFSSMTFPHQLMRLILMEQIYRSFKIIRNEPYHK